MFCRHVFCLLAVLAGNDPDSSTLTVSCASMNTLEPMFWKLTENHHSRQDHIDRTLGI